MSRPSRLLTPTDTPTDAYRFACRYAYRCPYPPAGMLTSTRTVVQVRRQIKLDRREDKVEMIGTILLAVTLCGSWRECFALFLSMDVGADASTVFYANLGASFAFALLALEAVLILKYSLAVRDMTLPPNSKKARCSNWLEPQLHPHPLQLRMRFMTKRFGDHAPYWQFVIWGRQFLLTLSTLLPDLISSTSDATSDVYVEEGYESTIWMHAAIAFAVFVVAAVSHWRVQPYRFDFQNRLEFRLYVAGASIVVLAAMHTFMPERIRSWAEPFVETLLMVVLVLPALIAVFFLTYNFKRKRVEPVDSPMPCCHDTVTTPQRHRHPSVTADPMRNGYYRSPCSPVASRARSTSLRTRSRTRGG